MLSIFDRRFQRLAVAAALVAALGLAGCGRKGGLDPPPTAGVAGVPADEGGQPGAGLDRSEPGMPAQQAAPARAAPRRDRFFLDWLID